MRSRMMAAAAAAVLVAGGAAVQAQDPTQDLLPKPAAEMAQLAFFEGDWTCAGKILASPMAPAGDMSSTVSIKTDLGGFYQTLSVTGNMPNMPPFQGMAHTTWDLIEKQFVMFWFDNTGAWSRATSGGWNGDTFVYEAEGQMGTLKMKGRDTFTKNADGSFKHLFEAEIGGTWVPIGEETCRK